MRNKKQETRSKKQEKTTFKFEAPRIVGLISDRMVPINLQKRLDRIFKRNYPEYVCLPFVVEPKYLKNVVACMRLMDIEGLIVLGNHTRRIRRYIPRLDRTAKEARQVNVILRRKKEFFGYYFEKSQKIPFGVSKKH